MARSLFHDSDGEMLDGFMGNSDDLEVEGDDEYAQLPMPPLNCSF